MADGGTCRRTGQRGTAGVAEQVQHADGTASLPYLFLVPCPVHGLLRENAGVLEARGADDQRQIVPVDLPFLRQLFVVIPLPAALGRAVIDSVGLGPQRAGLVVFQMTCGSGRISRVWPQRSNRLWLVASSSS